MLKSLVRLGAPRSMLLIVSSCLNIHEIDNDAFYLVCTGKQKPTQSEFEALAVVLEIKSPVCHFV